MSEFSEISSRFSRVRDTDTQPSVAASVAEGEAFRIRAKMIGVLIRDARVSADRTLDDCARLLRTSPAQIEAWEFGDAVPSLPQLELLAYYLDIPISHFWGMTTFEASDRDFTSAQSEYLALRDRVIGALLRQAREEAGLSVEAVSAASGIGAEQIARYELGEAPLPMHELSVLADAVKKNMSYFLESSSHVGEWLAVREMWAHFTRMPEAMRAFAANPLNIGFIEIAMMFSKMPSEQLRRIGETFLDITL